MLTPVQLVKEARSAVNECDNAALCLAIDKKELLIDVREPSEYALGFIGHAINIPRGLIEFAIFDHPQTKPLLNMDNIGETNVTLYCKSGGRSALAAKSLQNMGFKNVKSLQGGIMGWESEGLLVNAQNKYQY